MNRLPETFDFLHEIHATLDLERLRIAIPEGFSRLISCDRVSLSEADLSRAPHGAIATWPPFSHWRNLGELFQQHFADHPFFAAIEFSRKSITFSEARQTLGWSNSPLYQDYFLKLDVKHQLSVPLPWNMKRGQHMALGLNRSDSDFRDDERSFAEMLAPHLSLALRNAILLDRLARQAQSVRPVGQLNSHLAVVDFRRRTFSHLPSEASSLLTRFFGREIHPGDHLSESLYRWLIVQRNRCVLSSQAVDFVSRRSDASLLVRLLGHDSATATLLINVEFLAPRRLAVSDGKVQLTRREREVLFWISEGKRNNEIAKIFGVSPRTVGKHVENILSKLNVPTRTAAARQASLFL